MNEKIILELVNFLEPDGYFARSSKEMTLFNTLKEKNYVKRKAGTKKVFILTDLGKKHIRPQLFDNSDKNSEIKLFFYKIQKLFKDLRTPVKPFVKIEEIKESISRYDRPLSQNFDQKLLTLHDSGLIYLEPALSNNDGKNEHGVKSSSGINYCYLMDVENKYSEV